MKNKEEKVIQPNLSCVQSLKFSLVLMQETLILEILKCQDMRVQKNPINIVMSMK